MPEGSDQDRTEAPTPRRRQEAREEGNVARSQDLAGTALLVGLLVMLYVLGPPMLESWRQITLLLLGAQELSRLDVAQLPQTLKEVGLRLLWSLALFAVGAMVIAVVANLAQVGFLLAPKRLTPKLDALNPVKGFARIFGSLKSYVGLLMNLGKMGLAGAVAWYAVERELPRIIGLQMLDFAPAAALGGKIVFGIGIKIALVLLVLAIIDYAFQRYSHEQQLKMTKQHVKEEMRNMEGDPQVKARRRQIAMQRAMRRIRSDVPSADVVVTNPTHYAVAIKYDEASMQSPRVVAKGADLLAMRIRELASANGVPIVERAPLARALYQTVEVGREIPEDFYAAVAELLAYVYQLDRQAAGVG